MPSPARRLIINADDFGFSIGVTDGILLAHRHGILTSTTLMTTMPDRDRAIDLAGRVPSLGVGIHLNLTQGPPLTKCTRLTNRSGQFIRSVPKVAWKVGRRTGSAFAQACDELTAQIEYAKTRGLTPTHVDSHKHVCHVPVLQDALLEACRRTGVQWVRTAREARVPGIPTSGLGYRMLARLAQRFAKKIQAAGLYTTDWFFGLATTGRTDTTVWEKVLADPPGDASSLGEVMVHPGFATDIDAAQTRLLKERTLEMDALCDPAVRAALGPVQLVRYGQ